MMKPACVLQRDAWLMELRQLEDRESLRPWLHKYGCFEKNSAWTSPGIVHLDNLKELAKKFRLHKSVPNFFRDYTTEDSLVAVLKRYVRNNAAFLSLTPSVAGARRNAHPLTDTGASGAITTTAGGGANGDVPHVVGPAPSTLDGSCQPEGGGATALGAVRDDSTPGISLAEMTSSTTGDGGHHHSRVTGGGSGNYGGVLKSDVGDSGSSTGTSGQRSKDAGNFANGGPLAGTNKGSIGRVGSAVPRRPPHPKRQFKGSILFASHSGGRKLFGHIDADTTCGMIQMSRMGLSSHNIDRLDIISRNSYNPNQRSTTAPGLMSRSTGDHSQRTMGIGIGTTGGNASGGAGGEDRPGPPNPSAGPRSGIQTATGGMGAGGLPTKQKAATNVGLVTQRPNNDDPDELGPNADETRGVSGGDGGGVGGGETGADASGGQRTGGAVSEDDYSQTLKIKAAQALFRMSLEPGGEMKLVQEGVVTALAKLMGVESVQAHRLVSGCLANLTTTREVTFELLQANGHQVLSFLVNGVKTPDTTTLENVATALCRCTYEARNHTRLVAEFNAAQALCYIMQRQGVNLKIISAKGMLNMFGLSSNTPAFATKLDVYMLALCSAMEDLARNEKESVQTFVCRGIQSLTSVPACLSRIAESGIVDSLLPLVKLNQKRPGNLARLASTSVNLAGLKSAHSQLVKQKEMVAVLCLLAVHPRLVESCCVAAACLSRTRDLEGHLAPLAITLVEANLPNEASVDCVAFFLQNVCRAYPLNEASVTSWLATEGDSASGDGRLACLSAIGHMIRQQEDADTPLLRAGLMSTLHAILDDPSSPFAPSRMEIQLDDPDAPLPARNSVILRGKGGLSPQGGSAPPAAAVGAAAALIAGGGGRGSLAGGPSNLQKRKPLDVLCGYEMDRILAVVSKICFSLTRRAKNRQRLVKDGLPALCAKVVKMANDDGIQFMAVACVFSLTQSPELLPDIVESGAADLALDALGHPRCSGRGGGEYLLAQLAVVAQVAKEPRFCRRLASPGTIDLLVRLARYGTEEDEPLSEESGEDDTVSPKEEEGDGGAGERRRERTYKKRLTSPSRRRSGSAVKVASSHLASLRYCVVSIAESLGRSLSDRDGGGEAERLSRANITYIVTKLVDMVCSVVLISGPEEALMRKCALVMAGWSIDPHFVGEMGLRIEAGNSLALLMRSVTPATNVCASVALCNIAAASHTQKVPPRSLISAAASPASQVPQPRKGSDEEEARTPLEAVEESANPKQGKSRECGTIANVEDNNKGRDWLRSTGILREIIARGLVRATGGVIGNLLKAMNNLMCSETTRTELVNSHQMAHLFELIHGYTPEVRELAAVMLYNLTCQRSFHQALLEAGITYTLLDLLGPSKCAVTRAAFARVAQTTNSPAATGATNPAAVVRAGTTAAPPNGAPGARKMASAGEAAGHGDEGTADGLGDTHQSTGSSDANGAAKTKGNTNVVEATGNAVERDGSEIDGVRMFDSLEAQETASKSTIVADAGGVGGGGDGDKKGPTSKPSLRVRRSVLGALLNLTTASLSHPMLDPSAVVSLLTLVIQDDNGESVNEEMAGDLIVAWQAVVLQLSFVERYRPLIVYHANGQLFHNVKITNDPLSGKSSVMSPMHDRVYRQLIMGTMVNVACEPSLYEELDGQVQVLREFLSEYELEASGGGGGGSGSRGGGGNGSGPGQGEAIGPADIVVDGGVSSVDGGGNGMGGVGLGGSMDARGGGGRDWVRHELCGQLVSNLFSSKTLRERLSKKPVAGILVGLLCGQPCRGNRTPHAGQSCNDPPSAGSGGVVSHTKASKRTKPPTGKDGDIERAREDEGPTLEGYGAPRPVLYGGGEEASAIASRFVCNMSSLYAVEGGFELPQRTFEALVKIAHNYNHYVSPPASADSRGKGSISRCNSCVDARADSASTYIRGSPDSGKGGDRGHRTFPTDQLSEDRTPTSAGSAAAAAAGIPLQQEHAPDGSNGLESGGGDPASSRSGGASRGGNGRRRSGDGGGGGDGKQSSTNNGRRPSTMSPMSSVSESGQKLSSREDSPNIQDDRTSGNTEGVGDWFGEGKGSRTSGKSHRDGSANWAERRQVAAERFEERQREMTMLWSRAVGALCSPPHKDLWPLMIDAGILGALCKCISSTALSANDEGLSLCSSALRNLSTAPAPRSLSGERAAACFTSLQRLLCRCPDHRQIRVDCAASMVNFVDASHVHDLQALDVVALLGEQCTWDNDNDEPQAKLVRELAVYSLSKLCTRDFVPTGERVVATITDMMDLDPKTIKRLEGFVRSLVTPLLTASGPWKYVQPTRYLDAMALSVLRRRVLNERPGTPEHGWSGERSADDTALSQLAEDVLWDIQVAEVPKEQRSEASLYDPPATTLERSTLSVGRDRHHNALETKGHGPISSTASTNASEGVVIGGGVGGGKHHRDEVGGGSGKVILSGHTNNGKISGGAVRTGAVHGGEKRLRNTLARLAQRVADAATAISAFGNVSHTPANLESRILRNPMLTSEDPPFELRWLLHQGKRERLRLFQESLTGAGNPSVYSTQSGAGAATAAAGADSAANRPGHLQRGTGAASPWHRQVFKARGTSASSAEQQQRQDGPAGAISGNAGVAVGNGGSIAIGDAGASNQVSLESNDDGSDRDEGFYILTVPDDKWISTDLPPEAGARKASIRCTADGAASPRSAMIGRAVNGAMMGDGDTGGEEGCMAGAAVSGGGGAHPSKNLRSLYRGPSSNGIQLSQHKSSGLYRSPPRRRTDL